MRKFLILLLLFLLPVSQFARQKRSRGPLVFTNVTVIDASGAPAKPNMKVIVVGNRIAALGEANKLHTPKGAQVIDGTDKFLIPGLWDMHVHLSITTESSLPLFVANGVTGVRDMGGDLGQIDEWRKNITSGVLVGPRIFRAGPLVDGPKKTAMYRLTVNTPSEARQAVDSLKQQGADFIKVHNRVPRDAYFALAEESRKQGITFVGHIPRGVSAEEASEAGQRSIEHTETLIEAAAFQQGSQAKSPEQALATYTDERRKALFKLFVKNGTWYDPTLLEYRNFAFETDPSVLDDPREKYLAPTTKAYIEKFSPLPPRNTPVAEYSGRRGIFQKLLGLVGEMQRAGVGILAGTDPPARGVFPGFSLHDELGLLVQAGLTPMQALQAATRNPAIFLGQLDSFGTIEKGKIADLVLLEANPLDNINNTRSIAAVVLDGELISKPKLDALLSVSAVNKAQQNKSGDLKLEPYVFKAINGQTVDAELGHLFVPENRRSSQSKLIELTVIRFRSTGQSPGPPLLYLVGGPGASVINQAKGIGFPLYMALREAGDFILLEQRGTDESKPYLKCNERIDYPLDKPLELKELLHAYKEQSRSCARYWRSQGVDLTGYNTSENADDVDSLRKALGIYKLNLFGTSYGTHLTLATIRRYEKNLNRVIIAGVEGPDHTYKLPGNIQKNVEDIAQIYKADPKVRKVIPDFMGLMKTLLDKLEKQPVTVEVIDPAAQRKVKIVVGKLDLQFLLTTLPGRVQHIQAFPEIAYAMSKDDFSALAKFSLAIRRDSVGSAMSYMMDCASGVSGERWKRIKREEKGTLVGSLVDFPFPDVCQEWGARDLGPVFRSPVKSQVPILLISGTLDGRTPVSNAQEIGTGFPNSTQLIVEEAGHVDASMFTPKTIEAMLQFLKGVPVSTTRIASPPLVFKPLN